MLESFKSCLSALSTVPNAAEVFSNFVYTVNENKKECDDCSIGVFEGDSALATTFAAVKHYPAPDATPVLAPTGGDDDDGLALARRHIVLL